MSSIVDFGLQKYRTSRTVRIVTWLGVLGVIWFGVHTTFILVDGYTDELGHTKWAVVLGNKVHPDGRVSHRLKSRLDRAYDLYKKGEIRAILVSGGLGKEGYQEAAVMSEYLIKRGVPRQAITEDPEGDNTFYTAQHTRDWMRKQKASAILVVTNAYHVSRCKLAFRKMGIRKVYGAHGEYPDWREVKSIVREFVAYYFYVLRSYPKS